MVAAHGTWMHSRFRRATLVQGLQLLGWKLALVTAVTLLGYTLLLHPAQRAIARMCSSAKRAAEGGTRSFVGASTQRRCGAPNNVSATGLHKIPVSSIPDVFCVF